MTLVRIVLVLLIHCLFLFLMSMMDLYVSFVLLCNTKCPLVFRHHLDKERRGCFFHLIIFLMYCDC